MDKPDVFQNKVTNKQLSEYSLVYKISNYLKEKMVISGSNFYSNNYLGLFRKMYFLIFLSCFILVLAPSISKGETLISPLPSSQNVILFQKTQNHSSVILLFQLERPTNNTQEELSQLISSDV